MKTQVLNSAIFLEPHVDRRNSKSMERVLRDNVGSDVSNRGFR